MERRQHERYDLQAPVSFSWKDSQGVRQRGKGILLNISGGGLFVATRGLPPQEARMRFIVSFRTVFADTHLVVRASAQVVRMEAGEAEGRVGFAAAIKTFTLRSDQKSLIEYGTADKSSNRMT